jgi:hypothetical protein
MSRFFVDDPAKVNPRALLNTSRMARILSLVAGRKEYIQCVSDTAVNIDGDVVIVVGDAVFKTPAAGLALTEADLDTGSFQVGRDYYVYCCDNGGDTDESYKISMNATYPAGYSAASSRKIGGFHFGKVRRHNSRLQPVNTSGQAFGAGWEANIADGILPRSAWTVQHRPTCSPEGMVYLGGGVWVDIYLSSDDGDGGIKSVHGATPLTGTEGLHQYNFVERALVVGKRLLSYDEWCQAAFGSPQGNDGDNANAWSQTTNSGRATTGAVARAVSCIGARDCAGNVWEWLKEMSIQQGSTSWAWQNVLGAGYGQAFLPNSAGVVALITGGYWGAGVRCGARAMGLYHHPWVVDAGIGCRAACDSL